MSREVMKLALEAWQTSTYGTEQHHKAMMVAMTEVGKAILVQQEEQQSCDKQEPVVTKNEKVSRRTLAGMTCPHVPAAPIEEEVEKWSSLDDLLVWASWAFVLVVGMAYVIDN